jgi:hypothetical protein
LEYPGRPVGRSMGGNDSATGAAPADPGGRVVGAPEDGVTALPVFGGTPAGAPYPGAGAAEEARAPPAPVGDVGAGA